MEKHKPDAFFDHFSQDKSTKIGDWLVKSMSKRIFEFAQVKTGCSILEIGPGKGTFAGICLNNNIDYFAIEPNEKMADMLERRGVNVLRNIVPPIPDLGRTFDVVVMINVMEHMDTMTAALELSKNVHKILNPGGKFIIYSPDYVNWQYHFFLSDFTHNYITTWRRLHGLLISAGFNKIDGIYQSGHYRSIASFLISFIASLLPFGRLYAMFPQNKMMHKLYKLQTPFLRRVLICGEKPT